MPSYDPDIPDEYFEEEDPQYISQYLYYLGLPYWVYKKFMFEWAKKTGVKLKEGDLLDMDIFPYIPGPDGPVPPPLPPGNK